MSAARLASAAIKIPKRINRGPTDILKTLASTVKPVPYFNEPCFADDPFLAPFKTDNKRDYLLAKLHGIRTARYIFNKRPELFSRDDSEPKIESFQPIEEFRSDMEFTEQDLIWCIENNDIPNGIIAYEAMDEKGTKLNDEVVLQFLELLCYTDGRPLETRVETDIKLIINDYESDIQWQDNCTADKIFNKAKGKLDPIRLYSSMISGLAKCSSFDRVTHLYDEFKELHPDKPLCIEGYEGSMIALRKGSQSKAACTEAIEGVVQHMAANLVKPDRRIFNAILSCHNRFNVDDEVCKESLKLFNDMKTLSIRPSLTTFHVLVSTLLKNKNFRAHLETIESILEYLNKTNFVSHIKDPQCVDFFYTMMLRLTDRVQDLKLVNRLHRLMLRNAWLFKNIYRKSRYYDRYFQLVVQTENLKNILEFYYLNVPMNFVPRGETYDLFGEVLDLYLATDEDLKRIGNHILEFRVVKFVSNDEIFRRDPKYAAEADRLIKESTSAKRANAWTNQTIMNKDSSNL